MTEILQNEYNPDYVSPPGETLLETLETIGMPQTELAQHIGQPMKTIHAIIQGRGAITAEIASQLEQVLRIPASFLLRREQHYQEALARLARNPHLYDWVGWLRQIPVQQMMQLGWMPTVIEPTEQVFEALKFFGVASPEGWQAIWECTVVAYRKSTTRGSELGALSAWLREGQIEAQTIDCSFYNEETFREALVSIRSLTVEPVETWQKEIIHLCASAGVAVVFAPELLQPHVYGAAQWFAPKKALIHLGLDYHTDDAFWFTFFHEAGHILEDKKRTFPETDEQVLEQEEQQADQFALNSLIDRIHWLAFLSNGSYTQADIKRFAREVGIAPGIVVGRLQDEGLLPPEHHNDLKHHLTWNVRETMREDFQ